MNQALRKAKVVERKRNKVAEEALQEPGRPEGLAMLAHDLRTGIASILAFSDLLPLLDGEEMEKMTEGLRRCSRRLVRMLDNLLVLEELGAGGRVPRLECVDAVRLVVQVASEFEPKARERDVSLVMDVPAGLREANLDRDLFERAVANLLDNAVRHTPPGKAVSLHIGRRCDNNQKCLVVAVSDEGPGIAPHEIEKVFDKFYKSAAGQCGKGSGLGLAIVKAAAEAQGGHVELRSELGKGSRFAILLPYR